MIDFFLHVAADENEYDLARIEVFRIFAIADFEDPDIRNRVGSVIQRILANSKDDDVRDYAAMAAAAYTDIDGVLSEIERILENKQDDSNLRWNAFAAIKSAGGSPRTADCLRRLLFEAEFAQSARRVLSEWDLH